MAFDVPFKLGPFIVDSHGRLQPSMPDQSPTFHLVWRGHAVHAWIDAAGPDGTGRLVLSAGLGRVVSTAGGSALANGLRRQETFQGLRDLKGTVGDRWDLRLMPDHRVMVNASRELALPASVTDLLTQVTCFLLELSPYLDLIEEGGLSVEPTSVAVSRPTGMANTWPG